MKKNVILIFILSAVIVLLLAGCQSEQSVAEQSSNEGNKGDVQGIKDEVIKASDPSKSPQNATNRKDTVVVALQEPGGIFTPYFYSNGYDGNVTSAIFPPLVDIDKEGKPTPGLAENWDISDDELTYTYHLRKGLKFDNGAPLTADDVAFTLTLLHDPAYDGGTDILEAKVKGGKEYKEGSSKEIGGIKVIDPQTIEITTEEVNARALRLLGGQVLSKEYYGKDYKYGNLDYIKDLYSKPVGAGPYKFDKYIPGQEVRYKANEYYYGGKPEVENFIYKTTEGDGLQFFETGEIDYSGFPANNDNFETLKSLGFANINLYTSSAYSYLTFNHDKPFFKDKKVRQAFIYGLNRQSILDTTYQGYAQVANEPVSPTSWAYTNDINPYEYDPEKAKELLDEAGWKEGSDGIREKDGTRLTIRYFTSKTPLSDVLIPIAKENYKEIGIELEAEQMDFNALLSRVEKGDHDLASFSTPMLTDPYNGVVDFHSEKPDAISGYKNEKVNQLIDESISTNDIRKRTEAYHELYKELSDDPPYIFLGYTKILSAHNARIKGFEPNGYRGITPNLPKLIIK